MWIMNIVWPVTALYFSVAALWGYFRVGREMSKTAMTGMNMSMQEHTKKEPQAPRNPTFAQAAISDSHCGAGCTLGTLGDIIAEFGLFALSWTLFGKMLCTAYVGDLLLAWLLGIAFQYFVIKPMRNLRPAQGLITAIKADTWPGMHRPGRSIFFFHNYRIETSHFRRGCEINLRVIVRDPGKGRVFCLRHRVRQQNSLPIRDQPVCDLRPGRPFIVAGRYLRAKTFLVLLPRFF
jgi:Domain of unknown function (DUF4396)